MIHLVTLNGTRKRQLAILANVVVHDTNRYLVPVACRGGGGQGGHGPRAQALEGAPAQLVGPNCKKKIRPRQISKVTSLQSAVADAGFTKRGGGRGPPSPPSPEGASRVGLCGRGGANSGGGRRCKHWPPGAGDPRYATVWFCTLARRILNFCGILVSCNYGVCSLLTAHSRARAPPPPPSLERGLIVVCELWSI